MCGIFMYKGYGFHDIDPDRLKLLIGHRGPDGFGYWTSQESRLLFAHSRLAIQDLTSSALQPMHSDNHRYTVIFNGEIYNFRELRATYLSDQDFSTASDTEVLLKLWALMGHHCLKHLEGMFAFVIYDSLKRNVHVVRDRFGIKPLYIYSNYGKIIICSEIKPILDHIDVQEDEQTISDFLEAGLLDHSERTFFKDISHFEPASHLILDQHGNTIHHEKYYSIPRYIDSLDNLTLQDKLEHLAFVLELVVRQSLVSDCKIAVNLSNGSDSALLACIIDKLGFNARSYTQFYGASVDGETIHQSNMKIYRERQYIPIHVDEVRDSLVQTHWHQEEPYSGLFIDGYSILYRQANNSGYKVFLDGNGLDEFFLGYDKYRSTRYPSILGPQSIDSTFQPFNILDKSFLASTKRYTYKPVTNAREHSLDDLQKYKIPRGLRFNDKVSMQHGCELRVPFLDHRLLDVAYSFSNEQLQNNQLGKLPLRSILSDHLGRDFAFQPKNHKQSLQTEWLKSSLIDLLLDVSHNGSVIADGIICKDKFALLVDRLRSGELYNSFQAWQVLSLEIWRSLFITKTLKYS